MTAQEFLKRLRTVKMCAHSFAQVLDLFLEYEKKYAEKRDKNAERMRTVRARVHAQSCTNTIKEIPPTPPKETTTSNFLLSKPLKGSQKEKNSQVARGTRIGVDFQPSQASLDWAQLKFGLNAAAAQEITEEVVDFWKGVPGQRGVKLDWDATWKNRVREVVSKGKINGAHQQVQRPGLHEAARAQLDRVRRGEPLPDVFGESSGGGGGLSARLLSRFRES